MIHNIQVGYKNFNLPEQVATYILIFFKVIQNLSRIREMMTSKITSPYPPKHPYLRFGKIVTFSTDFLAFAKWNV